ncbi:MAG: ComF family protein [Verrucomicrobiales bacterium]
MVRDLIYPPGCELCGDEPDASYWHLCGACLASFPKVEPPFCERCGEVFEGAVEAATIRCGNCAGRNYRFAFARAAYRADGDVRELIHRFKYGRRQYLRRALGGMLADAFAADDRLAGDWTLVPVPLHHRRQREREFNQARELCLVLAAQRAMPVADCLRRTRYTSQQARLTRQQRRDNLKRAFALPPRFKGCFAGKSVLLVDDVFTTGTTADACARLLLRIGKAERVAVLTVARG